MRIILVRHGETIENAAGILQGHLPGSLSEKGHKQAEAVAERLKNENIDVIYSSDLNRAVQTMKKIAKHHPEVPIVLRKELRERNYGIFQGKEKEVIGWRCENNPYYKLDKIIPEGESYFQVYERVSKFLNGIFEKNKEKTLLIVGHGVAIRCLITYLLKRPPEDIVNSRMNSPLHNTSVTIIDLENLDNSQLILENCSKHIISQLI